MQQQSAKPKSANVELKNICGILGSILDLEIDKFHKLRIMANKKSDKSEDEQEVSWQTLKFRLAFQHLCWETN